MKYVIASPSEKDLILWIQGLRDLPDLEFRVGRLPLVGEGCDAEIIAFAFAHDRYGGTPQVGKAQALVNNLEDGSPGIILATPPLPLEDSRHDESVSEVSDKAIEGYVFRTIKLCVEEAARINNEGSMGLVECILLRPAGLGLDGSRIGPSLQGVRRAISEVRGCC